MLGTGWNVCAGSCKQSCVHITNSQLMKHTRTAGKASNQAAQALLGWFTQSQQQHWPEPAAEREKKSTGSIVGAMGRGRTRGDKAAAGAISDSRRRLELEEGKCKQSRRLWQPQLWVSFQKLWEPAAYSFIPSVAITSRAEPRVATVGSLGRSFPAWTQPMVLLCLTIMKCFTDAKTVQRADTLRKVFSAAFFSRLPHEQDSLTISRVGSQHYIAPSETHRVTECDVPP